MQAFLPYPNFAETMAALANARLGKQRVEAYQILRQLFGTTRGWRNYPAVKMWRGYEPALFAYPVAAGDEWVRRGFRDDLGATLAQEFPQLAVASFLADDSRRRAQPFVFRIERSAFQNRASMEGRVTESSPIAAITSHRPVASRGRRPDRPFLLHPYFGATTGRTIFDGHDPS